MKTKNRIIVAENIESARGERTMTYLEWENYMGLLGIAFMGLGILCLFSLILIVAGRT